MTEELNLRTDDLSYEDWMIQLRAVAERHVELGKIEKSVIEDGYYGDRIDGWRGFWLDAYSPEDAFHEDRSYWE